MEERIISDFQRNFCPFGYGDIERALEIVEESKLSQGSLADYLFELVENYKNDYGYEDYTDIDPVAVVYDYILQTARGEIEEKTGFDLENDSIARTSIYVAGNYLATNYDRSEDAVEELRELLKEKNYTVEEMSEPTQWFLNEVGV
jgi:hypothetical protein